jgi:hypothetical protein
LAEIMILRHVILGSRNGTSPAFFGAMAHFIRDLCQETHTPRK